MTAKASVKIFNPIYRVASSNTTVSGLGPGLSMDKQIVDLRSDPLP